MSYITLISNCLSLRTFKYWKLLRDEFPHNIIRRKEERSSFVYGDIINPRIIVGRHKKKELATALLHEIGHFIDYKKIKASNTEERYWKYNKIPTKRSEKNAWKYAVRLSKQYDIDICPKLAKRWLGTYDVSYQVLNNMVGEE